MIASGTVLFGEFLGTFLLVMTMFASGGNPVFMGLILALITLFLGKVSGANVNPAVSLAMYVKGALGFTEFLSYVASQLLGGVSSYYVVRLFA
jgi:aquaporin Z